MNPTDSIRRASTAGDVKKQVTEVAESLQVCLIAVANELVGPSLKPSRLVTQLKIDKSLASRLVRGLRCNSPFELIHFIPSPTGLIKFLAAAREAGADAEMCGYAQKAINNFQNLLDAFPEGRSSLDALISDSVVEVRQRAERTAKQGAYKAMSYLLGFHCEKITSAVILQPSADGKSVDGIDISRREGIRRLRPSTPVALFSVDLHPEVPADSAPRLDTLDGKGMITEPMSFFMPEFCEPEAPAIDLITEGTHHIFALSTETSLQKPVTITSAIIIRNGWSPHRTGAEIEDGRSYLLHYPCKLLVRDLFIRDDLFVGAEPQIRLEFPSPTGPAKPRLREDEVRLNTLDMTAPVEQLGIGLGNVAAQGIPGHDKLLARAFETAGWDSSRFRGYRTRIVYPVPMITMGWWIPLRPGE